MRKEHCIKGHVIKLVGRNTGGRCKECAQLYDKNSIVRKNYYIRNKQKIREKSRKWSWIKIGLGLTIKGYNDLFQKQNGLCAICEIPQTSLLRAFAADHNHKTGKVRGLLCNTCNRALGFFRDDLKVLQNAVTYLSSTI